MRKNHCKGIKTILILLTLNFLLIITYFITLTPKRKAFLFLIILGVLLSLLGTILIVKTTKQVTKKRLRIALLITGSSAISPLVFTILHNLFYALTILSSRILILKFVFEFLHVTSFLIATIIAPTLFLISVIISLVLLKKDS